MNYLKKIYQSLMLVLVVAVVTFILTSVFMYHKLENNQYVTGSAISPELVKKIYALKQIIESEYISEVDEKALIDGAIKGYVNGIGDDYTEYFTKEEMDEFKMETEGNYVGIGIYMFQNTKDNTVVVLATVENSPAQKAGLQAGDIIRKVDNVAYTGDDFERISTYIKGKKGTSVQLEIERNGERLIFDMERENIELYPIQTEILENKIGYIQITSFTENISKEFKEKYNELNKKGIEGLIIDLRNNGGGIVEEVLEIADYVLEKENTILITRNKEGEEDIEKSTKKPIISQPIVILVNEDTASASEILTAALKENGKATIVGETTYGKGVIQELLTLSDGSGIKITIEEYYTPNKNKINEIGIEPDIKVSLPKELENSYTVEKSKDTQLQAAIKALQS